MHDVIGAKHVFRTILNKSLQICDQLLILQAFFELILHLFHFIQDLMLIFTAKFLHYLYSDLIHICRVN